MTRSQLGALLAVIIPDILSVIIKRTGFSQDEAIEKFYNSKVYSCLSDEKTGVWHYSSHLIAELFEQERSSGGIIFPQEAS
ncbi:MAG: hypothetical protein FWC57_05375 [Endomicrobia bacterium]|nr:hypothetical protein [Endomicrobiia bacterium]